MRRFGWMGRGGQIEHALACLWAWVYMTLQNARRQSAARCAQARKQRE